MYINILDQIFDEILNKFNVFLNKKNILTKFKKDVNFVKFQNEILNLIKNFLNIILKDKKLESQLEKAVDKKNLEYIHGIIERYIAYYIYLSIAYYYKGGRDLFITNLIESSKNQKNSKISIKNFFNSENNSKLITFFSDIKNILGLLEFKTIDRINIIINNSPLKYENVKKIINELGSEYFETFFMIKDNFHNIIKTFIFRLLYLFEDRNSIIEILNQKERNNSEYKFIEIVVAKDNKIADFTLIQDFLSNENFNLNFANDIYNYLEEFRKESLEIDNKIDYFNYLFEKKIFSPICEDFLRYHKDSYKYDVESLLKEDIKQRDATKIKFIINKINKIRSYYSEIIKSDPQKKKKIYELFYKNLDWKKTVLYNDNEEIKIIQKLDKSDKTDDIDLLIDLENIRKYSYINFKNINGSGIRIRPYQETQAVRNINFSRVNLEKKRKLQLRMGNNSLPLNIVGLVFNPNKTPLECFKNHDLMNVNKINKNGYMSLKKILEESIINDKKFNKKNIYYYKFDLLTDKINSNINKNSNKYIQDQLKVVSEELYFQYFNNVKSKLYKLLENEKNLTIWAIKNLFDNINKNIINLDQNEEINNNIEFKYYSKIVELDYKEKSDKIIDKKNIIKLVPIKKITDNKYVDKINIKRIGDNIDLTIEDDAICNHYIEWNNIKKISNKDINLKNQLIFDFVKKYVKENDNKDYVCKSCGEMLKLKKYVFEGTYVKELDIFLTTSLATHQKLEEIPKYSKFNKIIKNLTKNLESISSTLNLTGLIGNIPSIVLRRKMIIQNVIDTILLNTKYIRNIGDETKKNISKLSNIKYSNVIFFNLNDSIFITRSDDVDKLKILKYNNLIAYLILFMLVDLNQGMILSIKENKKFNFYLFEKLKDKIFGDIKLRIDEKSNIKVINLPIFAYVLYMISANVAFSSIWFDTNYDIKKIPFYQLTIIQTVIDIFNIIINANFSKEKKYKNIEGNYLFEILAQRFMNKIKTLYNDKILFEILRKKGDKLIKRDNQKISFITKKVKLIDLPNEYEEYDLNQLDNSDSETCISSVKKIEKNFNKYKLDFLDEFTNCPEGNFHEWIVENDQNLICKKCNANFNKLSQKFNNTSTEKDNVSLLEKIRLKKIMNLTRNYCLDGKNHDFDVNKKCKLCKINPFIYKYSNKELLKLEKNLEQKKIDLSIVEIKSMKEKLKELEKKQENNKNIIKKFNENYKVKTNDYLRSYINKFIDKLNKISGNKIKINNKEIYLSLSKFIIKNDYLGKNINKPIELLFSNNFNFQTKDLQKNINKYFHPGIQKLVYCYYNRKQKYYMFYDCNNLTYLGYSNSLKTIKYQRSKIKLVIEPSLKEKILNLGIKNIYINLIEKNQDFLNKSKKYVKNNINKNFISELIREKIFNLKQIIKKSISIIEKVNNKEIVKSKIFSKEDYLVKEFNKILKNINLQNKDGSEAAFENLETILNDSVNNLDKLDINLENKLYFNPFPVLDTSFLEKINNLDCKLIFYYIFNFDKILDFNNSSQNITIISYLLIRIIDLNYNSYKNFNNLEIERFKAFIYSDQPYINEYLRVEGVYNELKDEDEEEDEEEKNKILDNIEAAESLDIDDYEDDDPEGDNYMEALNYEFD